MEKWRLGGLLPGAKSITPSNMGYRAVMIGKFGWIIFKLRIEGDSLGLGNFEFGVDRVLSPFFGPNPLPKLFSQQYAQLRFSKFQQALPE